MSFQLDSVGKRLFIFRCYIFPYGALTIKSFFVAIRQGPCGSALQVASDVNADLVVLEGNRHVDDILASISTTVLEYMSAHFLTFRKYWARDGRTW